MIETLAVNGLKLIVQVLCKDFNVKGFSFNPFVPNASFIYLLKTSENHRTVFCFQEVEKGYIGNEWVKKILKELRFKILKIPESLFGAFLSQWKQGIKKVQRCI